MNSDSDIATAQDIIKAFAPLVVYFGVKFALMAGIRHAIRRSLKTQAETDPYTRELLKTLSAH